MRAFGGIGTPEALVDLEEYKKWGLGFQRLGIALSASPRKPDSSDDGIQTDALSENKHNPCVYLNYRYP